MVFILSTQQECQTIQQVDTPQGGNTAMKGCWWSQVIQLPFGGEMPPIRLAGCRETQAWTYAKTDPNRRPILSMMHSLPGIRFHTRVRYVSAGLNNLKSELSISVNCYTSVNVDLSMSLNCSFLGLLIQWQNK